MSEPVLNSRGIVVVAAKNVQTNETHLVDVISIEVVESEKSKNIKESAVFEIIKALFLALDNEIDLKILTDLLSHNGLSNDTINKVKEFCVDNEFDL